MSTFKARGIILKEVIVNDTDKILNILFKDKGKLKVWARNSRSSKSKLFYGTKTFSYADFIIYDNGKTLALNQIDLIENFYSLTEDLEKLAYGTYFLEITDKATLDNIACNEIMLLLLKSLSVLSKNTPLSPKLIAKIFDLKFLQLNGYMPNIESCIHCSSIVENTEEIVFGQQGIVCKNCNNKEINFTKIKSSTLYIMNYILSSDLNKLYKFNTSLETLENLSLITKKLMDYQFYFNLKSKNFILEIENMQ